MLHGTLEIDWPIKIRNTSMKFLFVTRVVTSEVTQQTSIWASLCWLLKRKLNCHNNLHKSTWWSKMFVWFKRTRNKCLKDSVCQEFLNKLIIISLSLRLELTPFKNEKNRPTRILYMYHPQCNAEEITKFNVLNLYLQKMTAEFWVFERVFDKFLGGDRITNNFRPIDFVKWNQNKNFFFVRIHRKRENTRDHISIKRLK